MKNLFKFMNKEDVPWVKLIWKRYYHTNIPLDQMEGSFGWKAHIALFPSFKQASSCNVSSGTTILLWKNSWEGEILQQKKSEVHSFAKNDNLSIQRFSAAIDWSEHFHLPLSNQAFNQFTKLEDIIPELHHSEKDKWTCR